MDAAPDSRATNIAFLMDLGRALHAHGASAARVEQAMTLCARRFDVEGQFFVAPTAIIASFGPPGDQRASMARVEPGSVNLERRVQLDELIECVLSGQLGAREAEAELQRILSSPPPYPPWLAVLCFGLSSACAARFFGGGWNEIGVSLAVGLAIGMLARLPSLERIFELSAAFVASALAALAATRLAGLSTYTVTLSGLIVLVPGFVLTTAMSELAVRHLASGTARFMSSCLTFLSLAFGVAIGRRVCGWLPPLDEAAISPQLPAWTLGPALVLAPLCFAVLLRARPRDCGWIVMAGVLAFAGGRIGAEAFGPELGACIGAFVLGSASNLQARWKRMPSAVTMVPGILMLVPGSIGFRSLSNLLSRDVVSGIDTAFSMILVAIGLVAGLFFANLAVPPRSLESSGF